MNDTYTSIWLIEDLDGINYRVVKNNKKLYKVFYDTDLTKHTELEYKLNNKYVEITGKFAYGDYYFETYNNLLHSYTNVAICCPNGLDVFNPNQIIKHYLIKGKIVSKNVWTKAVYGSIIQNQEYNWNKYTN